MKIIEVYRIKDWYHYLGFVLIGFFLNSSFDSRLFLLLLTCSFMLSYAFSFNDFWDNGKKAYFVFPLFLSFLLFPFLNMMQILLASIFLFIVTIYSLKPIRLKAKPFLSSLCNGVGFTILFLLGYCLQSLDIKGLIFFMLFFCFNMVAQFIHEVVDLEEDKKNKDITTAVFLGEKNIKILSHTFLWLAFFFALYLFILKLVNFLFLLATFFFTSFFSYRLVKDRIDSNLRKKYRSLGIITGLVYLFSITLW